MSDSLQSMDCSPAGSSVCGILQARILEWATMLSTRRFSQPMNRTLISCIAGGFFTAEPPGSPCESVSCVILVSCVQKITDWKSFHRWKALQELIGTRYFQANLCIPNSGIFLKIMVMSFGFGQITQLVKWPGWDSDLVTTMPHGLCKVWHSIQSWGSTSNTRVDVMKETLPPTDPDPQHLIPPDPAPQAWSYLQPWAWTVYLSIPSPHSKLWDIRVDDLVQPSLWQMRKWTPREVKGLSQGHIAKWCPQS